MTSRFIPSVRDTRAAALIRLGADERALAPMRGVTAALRVAASARLPLLRGAILGILSRNVAPGAGGDGDRQRSREGWTTR